MDHPGDDKAFLSGNSPGSSARRRYAGAMLNCLTSYLDRIDSGVRVRWREDSGFLILRRLPDGSAVELVHLEDSTDAARAYRVFAEFTFAQSAPLPA